MIPATEIVGGTADDPVTVYVQGDITTTGNITVSSGYVRFVSEQPEGGNETVRHTITDRNPYSGSNAGVATILLSAGTDVTVENLIFQSGPSYGISSGDRK